MKKVDYLQREVKRMHAVGDNECFVWPFSKTPTGYGKVRVEGVLQYAHRHALFIITGTYGDVAAHSCDNPACINPGHLRWTDTQGNLSDMALRERSCLGAKNNMAKLTGEDVRKIRQEYRPGVTHKSIAERYGVSGSQVARVLSGDNWGWVS
ncbi:MULTISPECIES: hypothetical protein [unclassified Halomonas]|uniref:hypothetical protein n=1 Tax=unclassified Halomonas TaxID=2609666 RepID=UPI0020768AFE|nr:MULTISPECIES: hypothetical protein [unclassified Halomonas]